MLSLYHDGGERGTCSGSVLVAPFVHFFIIVITTVVYLDGSLR